MAEQEYQPFPGVVCQRIRNLVAAVDVAESERKTAFDDRDNALTESRKEGISVEEKDRHLAEYGSKVLKIQELKAKIAWCWEQVKKVVRSKPDEPGLYEDAQLEFPDFSPKVEKKEGSDPRAKSEPVEQRNYDGADGVAEHMRASPNELDIRENLKGKLIAAGFNDVGSLAKFFDEGNTLEIQGIGDKSIEDIKAAVEKYRSEHRKADFQQEREQMGEAA